MNATIIEIPKGPSARKPRTRHAPHHHHPVPAKRQGGRARTRPALGVAFGAVAAGWVLAFVALFAPLSVEHMAMAMTCSAASFGFGVGWIVRGEVGRHEDR